MILIRKILVEDMITTRIQQLNGSATLADLLEKIQSIPTIDPIATIDEMIEGKGNKPYWDTGDISVLRELKSRLFPKQ